MEENSSWNFPLLVLTLNSLCTFALNLSVFLVITHTSALTIRVAGVVKDWVVVLLSAICFLKSLFVADSYFEFYLFLILMYTARLYVVCDVIITHRSLS